MESIVTPGTKITSDQCFMRYAYCQGHDRARGHGTFVRDSTMYASVAGSVERVNKLITVRPPRARYVGEIGDVVIGRIVEVGPKRWKVDVCSRQDAALMLSSIHLPGAIQRRKSESDELQMRSFFAEGEMICAEVQSIFHDGGIGIHTRNLKYGKLVTGELLKVQSGLVKRSRSHFLTFEWGVDVILGMNGCIWVGKVRKTSDQQDLDSIYCAVTEPMSTDERRVLARVRNAILSLEHDFVSIDEQSIRARYQNQ